MQKNWSFGHSMYELRRIFHIPEVFPVHRGVFSTHQSRLWKTPLIIRWEIGLAITPSRCFENTNMSVAK